MEVDFVGGFYQDSTRGFDSQRCINWYPVFSESGKSKSRVKLTGTPGLPLISTASPTEGSGCRGLYETSGGRAFGVWGNKFYEFNAAGLLTDKNPSLRFTRFRDNVSMADNGLQVIIIDQGKGYIFTLADNTFVQITNVNFPSNANQVIFHDNFFVVSVPGTKRFYWSANNDGLTWDALDFASMVSSPDNIAGIIRTNSDVWMIGEKSLEPWQNVAIGDVDFERMPGAPQSIGTKNPWTIKRIGDVVYWLGSNKEGYGVVFRTDGYGAPQQVSTDAINNKIRSVGETTDAIAYTYQEAGHNFYVISIPTLDLTFAFDVLSGKWHERLYWNTTIGKYQRHRSTHHTFAFGKNWTGFSGDNKLSQLDPNHYFDDTAHIRRLRSSAHQTFENHLIRHDKFELEFERGQGLPSGEGSLPKAFYRYSDDGGFLWSVASWRGIGASGDYRKRATWASQGMGRDRVHEIVFNDPVKSDIIGAYMDIEVLKS